MYPYDIWKWKDLQIEIDRINRTPKGSIIVEAPLGSRTQSGLIKLIGKMSHVLTPTHLVIFVCVGNFIPKGFTFAK